MRAITCDISTRLMEFPHVSDVEAGVVVAVPGHAQHQFAGGDVQLQVLSDSGQRLVQGSVRPAATACKDVTATH